MTSVLVVCDSSSLILLAKANLLELLCKEFSVEIPEKVFEETVVAGKKLQKIDALKIEDAVEKKLIGVKGVIPAKAGKTEKWLNELNLDDGEKEAIQLYLQRKAHLLVVDDKQAIKAAKLLEINWTTAPGLVVGFVGRKKLRHESALEALKILQKEGRYRLDFILEAFDKIEKIREVQK